MNNPKIRIESDGNKTEVYIDGQKIENGTNVDFHAGPVNLEHNVQCTVMRYKTDADGKHVIENGSLVKEIAFELY
jgi:hypothetical protein